MSNESGVRPPSGVNVVGMLSSATGLGCAGRSTLELLAARSIAHVAVDIEPVSGVTREDLPSTAARFSALAGLPYSSTLFQLNPDILDLLVLKWMHRTGFDLLPTVNAIVPFWELPKLPASWTPVLGFMDAVLAPTRFVRDAVTQAAAQLAGAPLIIDYPQAIRPPVGVTSDRDRWFGARAHTTVFLLTFDMLSDIERKNPWAAIEAFQKAFAGRDDASLVIKVNHADAPSHLSRFERLRSLAAADERISLRAGSLSRQDMWSLSATADAYVSMHRAEGLGLGLMEAMAVGTPVVATGWSGNMDFMDDANSVPLPFALVPVGVTSHPAYADQSAQCWADPDVDAAAKAMRQLADSPDHLARLGEQALASIQARWLRHTGTGAMDELLALADNGAPATPLHRERAAAARRYSLRRRMSPSALLEASKQASVRTLRRGGLMPPAPADEYDGLPPHIS